MNSPQEKNLKRVLGFWAIVAFGVGDILGAGIYALVGKVAGVAGTYAWAAFAVSMSVAAFTAFSYAELSGRLPKSGGEAAFCQKAFRSNWIPLLIGWMVLCSGMVSMATVSRACAGYVGTFLPGLSVPLVIIGFLLVLTGINFWGMRESSIANLICTGVELFGLLIVIIAGICFLSGSQGTQTVVNSTASIPWTAILKGGALSFFAFIGFEDMVNVAEEVKEPERNLPKAILTALFVAGGIYMVISFMAVLVVPPAELAASKAPLLEVVQRGAPWFPVGVFTVIALFAVSNTALLNYVMGSRLVYGMSQQGLLPSKLGSLHPSRQTPHIAMIAILVVVITLALFGEIVALSGTTSTLLLLVFFTVNMSLIVLKRRSDERVISFRVPLVVPLIGAVASLGLIAFMPPKSLKSAVLIVLMGLVIVALNQIRGKGRTSREA